MSRITAILPLLCIISLAAAINVRVTCQPCTITCARTNCYRIRGDGYDRQQCNLFDSCDVGLDYTVNVDRCDSNFYGSDCDRGYCYYPQSRSGCASSILGQETCDDPFWFFAGCRDCQETDCQKCRGIETSLINGTSESCIGNTCNGLGNVNVTVSLCQNNQDSFGNQCNCCFNIDGDNNGNLGLCTQDSSLFERSQFNTWVRNKLGLGQMSLVYGAMVIAGFIMLLH